ncbi:hypothetical protein ACN7OV_04275 [Aerococcus urinaeequi]|uniref:Uncharacterized protein n=1 Tax=Aerococcus urinaeequi TaxID=51665 RepID=A0AA47G954_9LACT|nr:hypothetical protein [Aerococcus urinaeequi]WAT24574.1 hypothetical protein OZ415_00185 [Aerococcus urinaeequi]
MELVSKMNVERWFSIDSWLRSKGYSLNFDYIRYAKQPTDIYTLFILKGLEQETFIIFVLDDVLHIYNTGGQKVDDVIEDIFK